jgi:hypothetical protein
MFTGLQFQIDPLNRRRDAARNVICTSSKVPFVIDRSQPNLLQYWRMRGKWYFYSFREIPWKKLESAWNVLCTSSNVSIPIYRLHPNLYQFSRMRTILYVYNFGEISWIESVMLRRTFFLLPVKCPSLLTDRNEIYIKCGACAVSDRFTVSKSSLEQKVCCCDESTLYL